MESSKIRQAFFDFFISKGHQIVPSAPMVIKDDPTLMFTNAGMNQFKDYFLGNEVSKHTRIADTQKCLRVSGKHNDLEEVGIDTYHHTMFEMLGNWSFGDYFKKEAIDWAWEFLTGVLKVDPSKLYATVFGGDASDGVEADEESKGYWQKYLSDDHILYGSKKDNFWEMGDTGPCGPCSEVHIDLRDEAEQKLVHGRDLVNRDHPQVIEIWNLVFIEFNRTADGSLKKLKDRHVDTGMGFERLCRVIQGVRSNYDTDLFKPLISQISVLSGKTYGADHKTDVAMRVVADHIRAITFAIADGQLPSNVKAGYVIRRILRRAVRYGYSVLGFSEPFLYSLVPVLSEIMGDTFPEISSQQSLISRVIAEEESAFLRTLASGTQKFMQYIEREADSNVVDGSFAFELFDTYGFPLDLTQLMARENGMDVDIAGFQKGLAEQKQRSRNATKLDKDDWVSVHSSDKESIFIGYENLSGDVMITRYRKVQSKKGTYYQIVLNRTPFYAESGGQVGDRGTLRNDSGEIRIINTLKENNLTLHITTELPSDLEGSFVAEVDRDKRIRTAANHTATHLMHAALRSVLGNHVEQKGSLVDEDHLRFDFSHYQKVSEDEIRRIETLVNARIRENILLDESREVPFQEALEMGAMALFGEKYADHVRVIAFDKSYSVELCGGTHLNATGEIGLFKIVSEGAIAAGVRRIEALTGQAAIDFYNRFLDEITEIKGFFKNTPDVVKSVKQIIEEKAGLEKDLDILKSERINGMVSSMLSAAVKIRDINLISAIVELEVNDVKDLAFRLIKQSDQLVVLLGAVNHGKPTLTLMIGKDLLEKHSYNAGEMIRILAREIDGGGGGQKHFATCGGKNPDGLPSAINKIKELL